MTTRTQRTSLPWMHAALGLAGLGTALLGPILPRLAEQWHMQDSDSGLLMAAKFCGAFLGGVTVSSRLEPALLAGCASSALGFGAFALAPNWQLGAFGLALGGFGIGRIITATNILAGRRFTQNRGSSLALLNLSFSGGAMFSALGAAWLLPHFALSHILLCFAAAFAVAGLWLWLQTHGESQAAPTERLAFTNTFHSRTFAHFAALLFLYGGLETCLGGWITTFAQRYGDPTPGAFAWSEYTTFLLWMSLTAGRAVSSALMLRVGERAMQRIGLLATALFVATLAFTHGALAIAAVAVAIGVSLSPFFPATFALLMTESPTPRQAAMVIAASGLGAASLPWLMGIVSTQSGSLITALTIPLAGALTLLTLSLLDTSKTL